jgi:hypothetical protein
MLANANAFYYHFATTTSGKSVIDISKERDDIK